MHIFTDLISEVLRLSPASVSNTLELLDEGCTIPFIARYRKERTNGLNEVQIAAIQEQYERLKELSKRKETILKNIEAQGALTDELRARITQSWNATELEDIYLPYRPKRRTRAQIAREQGLEPLAELIWKQRKADPLGCAARFVNENVADAEAAIKGAQDILAERMSEDERARNQLRRLFERTAQITSKVIKTKKDEDGAAKFRDYFDWQEPLKRCSGNRLLAMRRGENEGFLRVSISVDDDEAIDRLENLFVRGRGACQDLVEEALEDAYDRLLAPSVENEFAASSKEKADEEAIEVFVKNLRQLLLQAPLGQKRTLAIDPGIRTGCKVVVLDALGQLLHHEVVFPFGSSSSGERAVSRIRTLAQDFNIQAIAVGNGTGGRDMSDLLKRFLRLPDVKLFEVSEDGASIYSASEIARKEFPNEDVTVRGAVSIGRRLMDPLAELVKIDPKSIGVGQYQHDVDQSKLRKSLEQTVQFCVNTVGVDVNTASEPLLTYVSGLGPALARNIIMWRNEHGAFKSREELKKVPRLSGKTFTQCAGFLRITNAENPLDGTAVHPESYPIVQQMAADERCTIADLIHDATKRRDIDLKRYLTPTIGLPTLQDIMSELEKPGRDPRGEAQTFEFDERVREIRDLVPGMILPGIVTNITKFGAFVDVGVHQDGLVHVSQLCNHFVKDPSEVVSLRQHVRVKVTDVDISRKRISLTMKFKED